MSLAVHFLKYKVLVACSRGFEVIDLIETKAGCFGKAIVYDQGKLAELRKDLGA